MKWFPYTIALAILAALPISGAEQVTHPFRGITLIERSESSPRPLRIHVVEIDLTAPGIRFKLTPQSGALETARQTTVEFLDQEHAQVAINAHFFLPFPSTNTQVTLIGLAASDGAVYSGFEKPTQSYALAPNSPALNIDRTNGASIVHYDPVDMNGKKILETNILWNTVSGSAQIITNGKKTIPEYLDAKHPSGVLEAGGPNAYSNAKSWYSAINARTAAGISSDGKKLVLFVVDARGGSSGMNVDEMADMLIRDYNLFNALNLDGGGSSTLAIEDPITHHGTLRNTSSDNPNGRSVGSNLAIFAEKTP